MAIVSVPKDGIALIKCESDLLSIFNLAGRELVVHLVAHDSTPDPKSIYSECIGLEEGFGIISDDIKDSIAGGLLHYVGPLTSPSVVIAIAMHACKPAVIDPMTILEKDSIMKLLTAKWLSALRKIEDTTERVVIWAEEHNRREGRDR